MVWNPKDTGGLFPPGEVPVKEVKKAIRLDVRMMTYGTEEHRRKLVREVERILALNFGDAGLTIVEMQPNVPHTPVE